jgi:hypothetical protein
LKIPIRLPRVAAAGVPIRVEAVLAAENSSVKAGDPLLELRIGDLSGRMHSEISGVIVDQRAAAGDELQPGRVVMWIDSAEPPPLDVALGAVRFTWLESAGVGAAPAAAKETPAPDHAAEIPELSLSEFRRRAQDLRVRMEDLAAHVQSAGLSNSADLLRAQAARLAACRFTVAVTGEFKRGKSTFLNALAGVEFLPHDVIPCTAFACRFQYGERLQLAIRDDEGVESISPAQSVPEVAAELNRLMSDPRARIQEAIIRLPLDFCRDGVDLVDTPGLNDSEAMNQVTLSVLPNVDAAVLLFIPESPVSETEGRFLADCLLASDIGRIVYVLNAKDRLDGQQLPRLVSYFQGRIEKLLAARDAGASSKVELIPVSSRQELAGPGSEESGFAELRRHLDALLFRERGRLLLTQTMQRVHRAAAESRAAIDLRLAQIGGSRESFLGTLQEIDHLLFTMRLHAGVVRQTILEAQANAQAAAATESRRLHDALADLRNSLPLVVTTELLREGPEKVGRALTSLLQQHAGHLYQMSVTSLYERLRAAYDPASAAVREFIIRARTSLYDRQAASVVPSRERDAPEAIRFSGGLMVRIGLSASSMSWLLLFETASPLLKGDLAEVIESKILLSVRENFGQEIERQVETQASQIMLQARFVADVRHPFNDLMQRFDQELAVMLGDTVSTLASLRRPQETGPDWGKLRDMIAQGVRSCDEVISGQ